MIEADFDRPLVDRTLSIVYVVLLAVLLMITSHI